MGILDIKNLSITLGDNKILHDINVEFWPGYIHALVGPNGSGKSTLAYCLMGLEGYKDIEGDIIFKGVSIKNLNIEQRAEKGITLAWQEPARYEGLTVKQFMEASSLKKGNDKQIKDALFKAALEPDDYMDRAMDESLSGGERKKIELASILIRKPKLVLLDEPDSGIDVTSLQNIFDAIKILKEGGSTIILITHSTAVLKQAEHGFLMCCGRIIQKGTNDEIVDYFEHKCTPCNHENFPDKV
jgi:Fe-S cluster assembly ATP-binding protein